MMDSRTGRASIVSMPHLPPGLLFFKDTTSHCPLAAQFRAQFIDMERIRAVILNEGITMQRVVYYMAFVVEGEKNLVVAFKVHTTT